MVSLKNVNELYGYLSRKNINNVNKYYVDNNLNTLLHLPQRKDVMKELIQMGGEKDLENVSGATPIMKQYHYETIQYLSTLGARIDKKDIFGFGNVWGFWQNLATHSEKKLQISILLYIF